MAIVSATEFFGSKPTLAKPRIVPAETKRPPTYMERTAQAQRAGIEKVKEGLAAPQTAKNPLEVIEGSLKAGAGIIEAAFAPVSAAVSPVISPVIEAAADKISDVPAVQQFARSRAGERTARVLESVQNATTIAGAIAPTPAKGLTTGAATTKAAAANAGKGLISAAGKGVESTGQKIQSSVIRPSIRDVKDGFNIENVAKYDVGGSLPETIAKSHVKLNQLSQELKAELKSSPVKINLKETLSETTRRLGAEKAATFGDNAALDRVLDQIADEIERVGVSDADLVTATNIKRGAGQKGSWAYNRPDPDASAIERVYTEFYNVLKEQIEVATPDGRIRAINRQISELIPIQNAALRRLPVEERNNAISLTDTIGFMSALFDPKALLLVGASKAARSGKVGEMLSRTGRKMQGKR
ncbi:MAG: hypothetical protein KF889_01555 [Alphaproteobacteria bacterium]|nr:hypothetical protein [Alphaproteobacteria bacterium]MCW5741591.1 hypothetical protein [Alphaproteobacteria bacterium]